MNYIKVLRCADAQRWYADCIGQVFERLPDAYEEVGKEWKTREPSGLINFVRFTDGELVEDPAVV
jgi:hypothetical protein